ncbi:MAG: response regulator [Bradymonadia bacterium]
MRIIIIEDEPKIAQVLVDYFQREGFTTLVLHQGTHAVHTVRTEAPDFVILDLMLPGKDGLTICRELRQFSDVPILMLTAKVEEIDRLLGLELGADDYVCKPFSPREVVRRAKTILRRVNGSRQPHEGQVAYRGVTIFKDRFACQVGDTDLELTRVEFRMLSAMLAAPGRVFSRQQLMSLAYDDARTVSQRTVDSHISNLRRKLNTHTPEDLLHSIYGVGYKLE